MTTMFLFLKSYDYFITMTILQPTRPLFQRIIMTSLLYPPCYVLLLEPHLFSCQVPIRIPLHLSYKSPYLPTSTANLLNPSLRRVSLCTQTEKLPLMNLAMIWVSGLSPRICGVNRSWPERKEVRGGEDLYPCSSGRTGASGLIERQAGETQGHGG